MIYNSGSSFLTFSCLFQISDESCENVVQNEDLLNKGEKKRTRAMGLDTGEFLHEECG